MQNVMLRLRGTAEPTLFELGAGGEDGQPLVTEKQGGDVRLYRGWLAKA